MMIGILLALQVNNWNEARKDRNKEQVLYQSLINSLESDLADVTDKIEIVENALNAQNIFMRKSFDALKDEYSILEVEQLLYDLSESSRSFFPNYGLYNKISGNDQIDLIRSTDLQIQIIELYEQLYKRYNDLDLSIEKQLTFSMYINFYSEIQAYSNDYGVYDIEFEILEPHYDVLNEECRRINTLTILTRESMQTCKKEIEALLGNLRKQVK